MKSYKVLDGRIKIGDKYYEAKNNTDNGLLDYQNSMVVVNNEKVFEPSYLKGAFIGTLTEVPKRRYERYYMKGGKI